jgi:nucleoside-diphosphate-sugar epimerase
VNVFLTGGSGFVGGAVLDAWRDRRRIRAMSRSAESDAKILAHRGEPIRCTLADVRAEQLAGCGAVVHAAACVEAWAPTEHYWQANVEGTRQLLMAAKDAGVRRFIHIGTEASLFHGQAMVGVDESYPLALDSPFPYSRTKAHAEKLVREANDPGAGFETIVIRPRMIWGPGDRTILVELKNMVARGQFRWLDEGRAVTSTTHIDNLVHALDLALKGGHTGAAYFVLDDGQRTLREFLTAYAATAGVDLPGASMPAAVARGLATVIEPLWRGLRMQRPPPITRFAAALMSRDCVLSDARARNELGYKPVIGVQDGLASLSRELRVLRPPPDAQR